MNRTPLLLALSLLPLGALAQRPHDLGGSSMVTANMERDLIQRRTAFRKGDILTIAVNETMQGQYSATTATNKSVSATANKVSLPIVDVFAGPVLGKILGNTANLPRDIINGALGGGTTGAKESSSGGGVSTTDSSFTTTLTVTVVDVDASGNLVIRGTRDIRVNKEIQKITLTGLVRPDDVTVNNTVPSSKIANANLEADGKGAVAAKTRRSLLNKIMDWLF